jgi:hypothetical protein
MKTGQLITSFLQGKVNPTMTSTIFSPYVDRVMEESRIGYFNGSRGAIPATTKGWGIKTVGVALLRTLNDLLPYNLRPIKSKRRAGLMRWGWGAELYYWRRRWHSHGKYQARKLKNKLQFWKR